MKTKFNGSQEILNENRKWTIHSTIFFRVNIYRCLWLSSESLHYSRTLLQTHTSWWSQHKPKCTQGEPHSDEKMLAVVVYTHLRSSVKCFRNKFNRIYTNLKNVVLRISNLTNLWDWEYGWKTCGPKLHFFEEWN